VGVLRARVNGAWVDVVGGSAGGGTDEVYVGTDDPIGTTPSIELWYDSDDDPAATDRANFWNSSWGQVARSTWTSAQTGITTAVALTGSSVTAYTRTGRRYRITAAIAPYATATGNAAVVVIRRDGTSIQSRSWSGFALANASQTQHVVAFYDETADGNHTFDVTMGMQSGSGSVANYADASVINYVTVEDIGPVTPAAVNPPAGQPTIATAGNALGIVAVGTFLVGNPIPLTGNTATAVTNNLPVTLLTGRRYRITFEVRAVAMQSAGAAAVAFWLKDSGSDFIANYSSGPLAYTQPSPGYNFLSYHLLYNGDGTTRNLVAWMQANSSIGLNVYPDNGFFYVEDVGPNQSPALPIPDTPPGWTLVSTFANSWVPYGAGMQAPRYRKIGDIVYLEGGMKGGTLAATAFTLPVGFRPAFVRQFAQTSWATTCGIQIDTGGVITTVDGGDNRYVGTEAIFSVTP
jgi:hypothetical protein